MTKLTKENKTFHALAKAFTGESAARNRYTYFAKAAKKEGYEQISAIFLETAENELQHAKTFFKYLGEEIDEIEIEKLGCITGLNKSTKINLQSAVKSEHEESTILYPAFSKIAKDEGFDEISKNFDEIIEGEKVHLQRYLDLLDNIENDKVFKKDNEVIWKCRKCGYHYKGTSAPDFCPACSHPAAYFELFVKNY